MLSKAAVRPFDLVLMDVRMPVMDGYEATKHIRALENKDVAEIPIVAMTANAFDEDRKASFEAGMNEHIAKPVSIDKLKDVLSKFL
jgi:CheY-like chemotaxis protein